MKVSRRSVLKCVAAAAAVLVGRAGVAKAQTGPQRDRRRRELERELQQASLQRDMELAAIERDHAEAMARARHDLQNAVGRGASPVEAQARYDEEVARAQSASDERRADVEAQFEATQTRIEAELAEVR